MNKNVTTKKDLIETAKEIAKIEGIDKVSIRNIAKKQSISVGALYNYFPTKADLIFSIVSDFWKSVLLRQKNILNNPSSFTDFLKNYYEAMAASLSDFEKGWLTLIDTLNAEDKIKGKELERKFFIELKDIISTALDWDKNLKKNIWSSSYTKEAFVDFVFISIMSSLRREKNNCDFLVETINRILY